MPRRSTRLGQSSGCNREAVAACCPCRCNPGAPMNLRPLLEDLTLRTARATLEEQEAKARAALACEEREKLAREFVFDVYVKELGRETAVRALNRIRLVETPAK